MNLWKSVSLGWNLFEFSSPHVIKELNFNCHVLLWTIIKSEVIYQLLLLVKYGFVLSTLPALANDSIKQNSKETPKGLKFQVYLKKLPFSS